MIYFKRSWLLPLLSVYLLIITFYVVYLKVHAEHGEVVHGFSLPLLKGSDVCVGNYLTKIPFDRYGTYKIERFSNVLESHPSIVGYLVIYPRAESNDHLGPVVNSILHECFPREIVIGKILGNDVSSLMNSLRLLPYKYGEHIGIVNIDADFQEGEFVLSRLKGQN